MRIRDLSSIVERLREKVNLSVVRSSDGGCYLRFQMGNLWRGVPVDSKSAPGLLAQIGGELLHVEISKSQAKNVLEVLRSEAELAHEKSVKVTPRIGGKNDWIEVLISQKPGRVARLTPDKFKLCEKSEHTFYYSTTGNSMPPPEFKGDLKKGLETFQLLTTLGRRDFNLVVLWMLAACRPTGPYPILIIRGGAGSGKSTLTKCIKKLIDPTSVPIRALPKTERDLNASARNNWVLAFDNVSRLSPRMSDALCRLSTGGGVATHRGQGDTDEVVFGACRPVILNGIDEFLKRNDLIQRAIKIQMPEIPNNERLAEQEWKKQFVNSRKRILGTILRAVAHGLATIDGVELTGKPRMADFLKWAVATGDAFGWKPKQIENAYVQNSREAFAAIADSDEVIIAIQMLVQQDGRWSGTFTDLLRRLENLSSVTAEGQSWSSRGLPKAANALAAHLNRAGEALQAIGVSYQTLPRDHNHGRQILLCRAGEDSESSDK